MVVYELVVEEGIQQDAEEEEHLPAVKAVSITP